MRRVRLLVLVLFFCSGISGLIYEVVWIRQLTTILGNTVHAVSTVLTAFMAGLALGSFWAGRRIDRRGDPLAVYGGLQIAIGALGVVLTFLLRQTGPLYVWVHSTLADYPALLVVIRYVFSLGLLIVPTTLMGATLPVLSRFVVDRVSVVGLKVGSLYALNTVGAAAGCFLAGFALIGNLGTTKTVYVASALSVSVGVVAWCFRRGRQWAAAPSAAGPAGAERARSGVRYLVLTALGISGMAALGYEVVWTRVLTLYLGSSVYAFSTMLTTFLIGLALGGLVLSPIVDRRRRLMTGFGVVEIAIAAYVLLSIYAFHWGSAYFAPSEAPLPVWRETGVRFLKGFALMLAPTFLMGAAFPIASRIYVRDFQRIGRGVGYLYAWNTVGAIIGSALTGFALLPWLGIQNTLLVLLCMNLVIGSALLSADPVVAGARRAIAVVAVVGLMGLGLLWGPRDVMRRIYEQSPAFQGDKILFFEEDHVTTVAVSENLTTGDRYLSHDMLDVAGTSEDFRAVSKSLGHLPMLLHPNPRSVFVLGFGGGGTSYAVSTYPEVRRIDSAELSRSVGRAAPLMRAINHDVMSDPRFTLDIDDGRHVLLTARQTYDVISVDLIWPHTAGAGSLHTLEFYELCRRRLDDDGLMVEWIHAVFVPAEGLKTILRTMQQAFPHVSLWWTRKYAAFVAVASKQPLEIDFARLSRRMQHPAVHRDLVEVRMDHPTTFLSYFIADGDALRVFVGGSGQLNTDDLPVIEYELPLDTSYLQREIGLERLREMALLRQSVVPHLVNMAPDRRAEMLRSQRAAKLTTEAFMAIAEGRHATAARQLKAAGQLDPYNPEVAVLTRMLPPPPGRLGPK